MQTTQRKLFVKVAAIASSLGLSSCLLADPVYFTGADGASLSQTSSWSTVEDAVSNPTSPPGSINDLVFNTLALGSADRWVHIAANNRTYNSMRFRSTGNTTILRGTSDSTNVSIISLWESITLDSGTGSVLFSNDQRRVNLRALSSLSIANNSSSNLTFDRNWDSGESSGTTTLTMNGSGSGTTFFIGTIANGSGTNVVSLNINNPNGITQLEGNNSYSGGTTLTSGTLRVRNNGALGTGTLTINGGTLASSFQFARTLSNNVVIGGDFALGGDNQPITLSGSIDLGSANRTVTLNNSATFSGSLTGTGGLTVENPDTSVDRILTLSGVSNYSGPTTVNSGRLMVNGSLAGSSVTVASGGLIGGSGSISGNLHFADGAGFFFSGGPALMVDGGVVSFEDFSVANIIGIDLLGEGVYTLIDGSATINTFGLSDLGESNAVNIGGGRSAYFQTGSLELVIIPEANSMAFLVVVFAGTFLVYRRRKAKI
jgi:autotransporter-associated beta strand protein